MFAMQICLSVMYADVCGDLFFAVSYQVLSLVKWFKSCVVLQIVELLSMEDVDITPEQIKDIIDLLEKESKLRKTSKEQSNNVTERTEWY